MSDFDDINFEYRFMQQDRERTPSPRPKAMSNMSNFSNPNSMNFIPQMGMPMGMKNQSQEGDAPQRRFSSGAPSTISAGSMQYQNIASYGIFKK